jgi:hypothetical protein
VKINIHQGLLISDERESKAKVQRTCKFGAQFGAAKGLSTIASTWPESLSFEHPVGLKAPPMV